MIDGQDEGEGEKVKCSKQVLGCAKVMTSVGDVVEEGVEVDKPSRVAARRQWREGILNDI